MRTSQRIGLKVLLVATTALAMVSLGGLMIFAFLPLAVGYWWAVRHSGAYERVAWVVVGALAAALWAWEISYPVHEGDTPASWIVAVGGAVAMSALLILGNRYRLTRDSGRGLSTSAN